MFNLMTIPEWDIFDRGFFNDNWLVNPHTNEVKLNVIENEAAFVIEVKATGLTKDQFKVVLTDNILTIEGNVTETGNTNNKYLVREFKRVGGFKRSLKLNKTVDANAIDAKMDNGVLIITLPKNEMKRIESKVIKIK